MQAHLLSRITAVKQETSQAKTYILSEINNREIGFIPGQFLTFLLQIDGQQYRRSFSIISLPGERVSVTVKRVENGAVSRYIFTHWKTGDELISLPPAGRFTVLPQDAVSRDIFFIVAGSGITPALPQLRQLLKSEPQSLIYLYYSNRSESDILFARELARLESAYPALHVRHFLSSPAVSSATTQRLNNGLLTQLVNEDLRFARDKAVFMICGPFTFMRMAWITLVFMKFGKQQIRRENFLPEARQANGTVEDFPERVISLDYNGSLNRVVVKRNQTILRAAINAGLDLPYSCEGGVCSTCALICSQGEVKMTVNDVLTGKELDEGWILTCTGHPASDDVVLKL